MSLSHPFSPRWNRGQMQERECSPLQHFSSPLPPVSCILPAASLGSHSNSHPAKEKLPASAPHPSWLPFPFPFAPVENHSRKRGTFLQLFPLCYGAKATPKTEPCFQSNPSHWVRRKMPKMENGICLSLAVPRCSSRNVFHPCIGGGVGGM